MLNIPGTMLICRRKERGKNKPSFIHLHYANEFGKLTNNMFESPKILFGEACILLNIKLLEPGDIEHWQGQTNIKLRLMKLLYKGKIVLLTASQRQIKRWFTYPDVWVKKNYDQLLEEFEQNGEMEQLKKDLKI